jgi:hypothetical protein
MPSHEFLKILPRDWLSKHSIARNDSVEGMRPISSLTVRRIEVSITSKAYFHMSRSRQWRTRDIESRKQARAERRMAKEDYTAWSNERLIERVVQLEAKLKSKNQG